MITYYYFSYFRIDIEIGPANPIVLATFYDVQSSESLNHFAILAFANLLKKRYVAENDKFLSLPTQNPALCSSISSAQEFIDVRAEFLSIRTLDEGYVHFC